MNGPRPGDPGFVFLNRDDAWLDFERHDLEIVGGQLRLSALPALVPARTIDDPALLAPDHPAGVAVCGDGATFVTDGREAAIARINPCDGTVAVLPSLGGAGSDPGRLNEPGGLACHRDRNALVVADSGNGRLQWLDLATLQLIDVWTGFQEPVDLAIDASGRVFVLDRGMRTVEAFTAGGDALPDFWARLAADLADRVADLIDPVNISIASDGLIAMLDRGAGRVIQADAEGAVIDLIELAFAGDALGLAITADAIFVGENDATGRVHKYRRNGSKVGVCPGYEGPVAGLAIHARGTLLVNPGWLSPPLAFASEAGSATIGYAVGGPFGGFGEWEKRWHALNATIAALPPDTHVTFAVQTTNTEIAPPVLDPPDPIRGYFASPDWQCGPIDLERFLIRLPERTCAWVGIQLESEGAGSPAIEQIRLDYDVPGYFQHLPEIYREDEGDEALLARYLALVASFFDDVESGIDSLPGLVDPAGTSKPWLHKLARWLGLETSPRWSDAELRDAVAHAYVEAAQRGTVAGLRASLRRYIGIDPLIEEPIIQAGWWALAERSSPLPEQETSVLGVSTFLVAAEPAGAVLGQSATIGRSHLIPGEQYGAPLFEGLAHRFMVRIDPGLDTKRRDELEAVIEREKPAHTLHELCDLQPRLTTGLARVGFDAVLGGDSTPTPLGAPIRLGLDAHLGGDPSIQLGDDHYLGRSTRLRDERR